MFFIIQAKSTNDSVMDYTKNNYGDFTPPSKESKLLRDVELSASRNQLSDEINDQNTLLQLNFDENVHEIEIPYGEFNMYRTIVKTK